MSKTLDAAFSKAFAALSDSVRRLAASVPPPQIVSTPAGVRAYRYVEGQPQQAIVLKSVRTLSALMAGKTLIDAGLALDAGASMRMLDELGSDIMFLAGPTLFGMEPEPKHAKYLTEFFQEEFDHADPLKSSQRRNRVSRSDIRAYVARTFNAGQPVDLVVRVTETIDNAFSGFIHGAAVHTMDAFDGSDFCVPCATGDDPLEAVRDQYIQYVHRALMNVAIAAKSVGDELLFKRLYELQMEMFDAYGHAR